MVSSSDTRSTHVWLEDTHITLRRFKSAQANNERITFVSALDQRNKWGYNVLFFRPPAATGKKAKAVTLYEGNWHKLEHDSATKQPYLGVERLNIHEFDGESLPSDNEQAPDSSDEEPTAPRPQSDSSSKEELTQWYTPPVETTTTTTPTTSGATDTHYRGESRELPLPNTHRSSIATLSQEQQPTTTNMATQTTTAATAMTTVRPNTPPATTTTTTTQTTTTALQWIAGNLQTAMWRAPGGSGGSGSAGNPGRSGRPGGPGGPGGPAPAAATPAAPAAAPAGNTDDRLMGSLPQPYEGDRKLARTFLNQLTHYFQANSWVPGLNSAICKVSIALTLFQGQQVAAWVHDMGTWIDSLDPVNDDIQEVWDTFVQEFNDHFVDSQLQQRARLELDRCKMCFPDIDQYISDFEDLVCQAGYTIGNEETIGFFMNGLTPSILDKVIRSPFPTTYNEYKEKAVSITKGRQMIELIRARLSPALRRSEGLTLM
jgi:Retrotransposon gag protein